MIQVIPAPKTFGSELGRALGGGISQGYSQASEAAQKLKGEEAGAKRKFGYDVKLEEEKSRLKRQEEQAKIDARNELVEKIENSTKSPSKKFADELTKSPEEKEDFDLDQEFEEEDPFIKAKKYAAAGEHDLAQVAAKEAEAEAAARRERKKEKRANFESDRTFNTQFSKPIMEESSKTLSVLPELRFNNDEAKRAIESGDTGWMQFFATSMGLDPLVTPNAAALASASKNFLLKDIGQIKGRPNQYIEQTMFSAYPNVGKTQEANMRLSLAGDARLDIQEETARMVDKLGAEDLAKHGYVKADILSRAIKAAEPKIEKINKDFAVNLRLFEEKQLSDADLRRVQTVLPGTPLTARMWDILEKKYGNRAYEAAKKIGFDLSED